MNTRSMRRIEREVEAERAGRWLRKFRLDANLTQHKLSERIGVYDHKKVSAWERGRSTVAPEYRQPICDVLGCQQDDIWT